MTELLYYQDRYLDSVNVCITAVKGNALIFDKTIFYPECGGQPGDRGQFGSTTILDTQKDTDGTPLHIVEDASQFKVGDCGLLSLDWPHRYKFMKEHSVQHLLSALLFHEKGIGTVAVHQGEEILTIETDSKDIPDEDLLYIEDKANEKIRSGLAIYQNEMSHIEAEGLKMRRSIKVEWDVKVVFIEGLDAVACGGVHVASTSEIGEICYRGKEGIRGHVRTIWSCSDEAVLYRRRNEGIVKKASRLLSAEGENIPSAIEHLQNEVFLLKRELQNLNKERAEAEYKAHLLDCDKNPIIFTTKIPVEFFQEVLKGSERDVFIITTGEKNEFLYYGSKERFLSLKAIGLKGGGRDVLFRGKYELDSAELIEKVRDILENQV